MHTLTLRRARPFLGTLVDIKVTGNAAQLELALESAFSAICTIDRLMSFHRSDSDVSRLNRKACKYPVRVAPETWKVLQAAQDVSMASQGVFDITVAPRLVKWDYLPALGGGLSVSAYKQGYQHIQLLPDYYVQYSEPLLIDLGGIAKGYAVDLASAAIEAMGINEYSVNAGGDIRVGSSSETIYIRHPAMPDQHLSVVQLTSGAIATSASYFSRKIWQGVDVHPMIWPQYDQSVPFSGSVSVLHQRCMLADALTKVVAVLQEQSEVVLKRFVAEACMISPEGERYILGARK